MVSARPSNLAFPSFDRTLTEFCEWALFVKDVLRLFWRLSVRDSDELGGTDGSVFVGVTY